MVEQDICPEALTNRRPNANGY